MIIKVKDYIENAFSIEDAKKLYKVIKDNLNNQDTIQLDFEGIMYFTTLFFNNAIVKYIGEIGPKKYLELFSISNISDVGKETYSHSLENGKDYYSLSDEDRLIFDEILKENQKELD